jgi:hypothetical protein
MIEHASRKGETTMQFDFENWAKLAKQDPAAFERKREAILREAIKSAPPEYRQRLEGLQFRLDLERRKSSSPLSACVRMQSLMWDAFFRLREELNRATREAPAESPAGMKRSAEIIPMRTRKSVAASRHA